MVVDFNAEQVFLYSSTLKMVYSSLENKISISLKKYK